MPDVPRPITVLLIDTNDISRAGLRTLLSEDEDFTIVADTATNGPSLAQCLKPMLILVDPERKGELDVPGLAALASEAPQSHICVRTSVGDPGAVFQAIEAGAVGYFLKASTDCTFLREALRLVGRYGAPVTDPHLARSFRERVRDQSVRLIVAEPDSHGLSDRECAVLRQLAMGMAREQIAHAECMSLRTVERVIKVLQAKLDAPTPFVLGMEANRLGLLT